MKALVTGAAGFLGSHLCQLLLERGVTVRGLVRPNEDASRLPAGVEVSSGDLSDRGSLRTAVQGVNVVFNCAARTGPWGPEADYEMANVRGLRSLLESAEGANVERLVHVSSITVHGNDVHGVADETAPFHIEPNPYSRTKVHGERLLADWMRGGQMPVTIVRPGWIYGPGDAASFAPLVRRIESGKMPLIGSGSNRLPLVYVRDVAEGMVLAAEARAAAGQAYLLVNDEPVTQRAYVEALAAQLGVKPPRWHIPYRMALALGALSEMAGHAFGLGKAPPLTRYGIQLLGGHNQFVVERARSDLGFSPAMPMLAGVRAGVNWYRSSNRLLTIVSGA